ncbi:14888_t:CDS:2, partial [Dentiscutata heterogama]
MLKHTNKTCYEPILRFSFVYQNNVQKFIALNYTIPSSNFCPGDSDISGSSYGLFCLVPTKDSFMIQYYDDDLNSFGLLIDPNGTAQKTQKDKTGYNIWIFSFYAKYTKANVTQYSHSSIDRTLEQIPKGTILLPDNFFKSFHNDKFNQFALNNEGIGFIWYLNDNSTNNPIDAHWKVYISLFYFDSSKFQTFLIYQTPISNLSLQQSNCGMSVSGSGIMCFLAFQNTSNPSATILLKINFLSSGGVSEIKRSQDTSQLFTSQNLETNLLILPWGGFSLINIDKNCSWYGYILGNDFNLYSNWSLPQPLGLPKEMCDLAESTSNVLWSITTQNKMYVVSGYNETNWGLINADFPALMPVNDFKNPIILGVSPSINSTINLGT